MKNNFDQMTNIELMETYSEILRLFKARGLIHSKNIVGDIGEFLAIDYYRNTKGLPKLQAAPPNTKNVDALSTHGDRYNIKTTTGSVTSAFHQLAEPGSIEKDEKRFEFLLIVVLDDTLKLKRINEVTWDQFIKYKKWDSRMGAHHIYLTKNLLDNTKTVYLAGVSI